MSQRSKWKNACSQTDGGPHTGDQRDVPTDDVSVRDVGHSGVCGRRLFWTLAFLAALLATGLSTGAVSDTKCLGVREPYL